MTQLDLPTIASVAAGECVRQGVGLDRLTCLLTGYQSALAWEQKSVLSLDQIIDLAGQIEPDNHGRLRITPVTFSDFGPSPSSHDVADLISSLVDNLNEHDLDARTFTAEFLWIHPFSDGNGRTAWVLYNYLNGSLDKPVTLPRFFGSEQSAGSNTAP